MTRELKAAIEEFKEGVQLMSEAIITIFTEVAKVIDEEDIDAVVDRFLEIPEEDDLPELEEIPDENPVTSRETLIIEDEDIRAWD